MRRYLPGLVLCFAFGWAQPPAALAEPPDDTVVARVEGRAITVAEMRRILIALPAPVRQTFQNQPKRVLEYVILTRLLARQAEEAKLDQESPAKEQLQFQRDQFLAQLASSRQRHSIPVSLEDQRKHYEANLTRYVSAKLRSLSIPFGPKSGDGNLLAEPQAKVKVEQLVRELRAGADFHQVALKHAADAVSPVKEAPFEVLGGSENPADPRSSAFTRLKPGEVSDPFREEGSFTVFQVVERQVQPFEAVQEGILLELQNARFREWFTGLQNRLDIQVEAYK